MKRNIYPLIYCLLCLTVFLGPLAAQSPADGLFMQRGQLCNMLQYGYSSWSEYWEGTNLRSNENLGTVTTQNVMAMSALGITDRLNVFVGLPYVWTGSDSYFEGQRGFQDFGLWVKANAWQTELGSHRLYVHASAGITTPVSNYVADYLPLSLGLHSTNVVGRAIVYYTMPFGLYVTAQGGYTWRSNVEIDRDSYLAHDKLYYTNEVDLPNVYDASLTAGYLKYPIQAEAMVTRFSALDGDDIRYNEGPFLTNKMQATSVGIMGKYWFGKFAVQASGSQVLAGRNVGKSTSFSLAAFYLFNVFKNKNTDNQ